MVAAPWSFALLLDNSPLAGSPPPSVSSSPVAPSLSVFSASPVLVGTRPVAERPAHSQPFPKTTCRDRQQPSPLPKPDLRKSAMSYSASINAERDRQYR